MEQKNRQLLCHDAGRLLVWIIKRLSIPRDRWNHTYCFTGQKKQLPTKKKDRKLLLAADMQRLIDVVKANQPCVLVGMGKLTCECLLDDAPSVLKNWAGTRWGTNQTFSKLGIRTAWISYTTDAALFDPELSVGISRVIGKAAAEAGIPIKINTNLSMFDWDDYV